MLRRKHRPVRGLASPFSLVGAIALCCAVLVPSGSSSASPTSATTVPGTTDLIGVTCGTPTRCLAVGIVGGLTGGSSGVVVPITNGIPGRPRVAPGTNYLGSVTCPTSSTCLAIGYGPIAGGQGVVVPITNGIPGSPQSVPGTSILGKVICVTPNRCLAVGIGAVGLSTQGVVVPITGGIAGTPRFVPGTSVLHGLACSTGERERAPKRGTDDDTRCLATGYEEFPLSVTEGVVVPITRGVPGVPRAVAGTSTLGSIVCATAHRCPAVGFLDQANLVEGVVVSITERSAGTPKLVPGFGPFELACVTASDCVAVGEGLPIGTGGAFVSIINGRPRAAQVVPGTNRLDDATCPTSTQCVASGFFVVNGLPEGLIATIPSPTTQH